MTLRAAFLMCARNKVGLVRETARRLLEQDTSWPLTIVLSDHWSTDGTYELMRDMAAGYAGPHDVEVMRCPLTDRTGILGLNAHLDWAVRRIDADVILFSSADDVQHPSRTERVMQAFADHPEADYVASECTYRMPSGECHAVPLPDAGWIDLKTEVVDQIGMRTGGAYRRDLWLRHGPMRGLEAPDLILPAMAALEGQMYLLREPLHESLHVPDPEGVSVERAMQAAQDTPLFLPLIEVNQYQFCTSHFSLMRRLRESGAQLDPDTATALAGKLMRAADNWVQWRDRLTMARVQPLQMRV